MKISFSPSNSSSSVTSSSLTSSSLDRNLNNNSENVTTKCFTSIIRRFLLCSGNQHLRTHPFDSSSTINKQQVDHQKSEEKKIQQPPATPGLVARLMGLDSMPIQGIMTTTHPDSIGRSRSMNSSMDCPSSESNIHHKTHGGHRRVQTCLSFRERPTFLELENDDFLLLSFENIVDESKEFGGSKERKLSEMVPRESKQRNENRGSRGEQSVFDQNKKDKYIHKRNCAKYERKISSRPCRKDVETKDIKGLDSASTPSPKKPVLLNPNDRLNRIKHKEVSDVSKLGKKKKKKKKKKNKNRPALKKVEPECNTENSSPVSVLDIDDFEFEQGSNSSEEDSRKTGLNLITKQTPDVVVNSDRPSIHFTRISIGELPEMRKVEGQCTTESAKKINTHTEDYIQLWGEVCMLTEEDMKTSNWMPGEMLKMEELEEIGTGFGLEILNQLLHEIAAELEEFPKTKDKF